MATTTCDHTSLAQIKNRKCKLSENEPRVIQMAVKY